MVARFAYLLLVAVCTVIAAMGGYEIGSRTQSKEAAPPTAQQVDAAVAAAVKKQKAADRAQKRADMAKAMAWQRRKFDSELSAKVSEVRLAEAENAARAYRRGKAAGLATVAVKETEADEADAAEEPGEDDEPATAAEAEDTEPQR